MRGPYTLKIDGETFAPSSFGELRDFRGETIYNPDNLWDGAQKAASRIAFDLVAPGERVSIEILGHIKGQERVVGYFAAVEGEDGPGVVRLSGERGFRLVRRAR